MDAQQLQHVLAGQAPVGPPLPEDISALTSELSALVAAERYGHCLQVSTDQHQRYLIVTSTTVCHAFHGSVASCKALPFLKSVADWQLRVQELVAVTKHLEKLLRGCERASAAEDVRVHPRPLELLPYFSSLLGS